MLDVCLGHATHALRVCERSFDWVTTVDIENRLPRLMICLCLELHSSNL